MLCMWKIGITIIERDQSYNLIANGHRDIYLATVPPLTAGLSTQPEKSATNAAKRVISLVIAPQPRRMDSHLSMAVQRYYQHQQLQRPSPRIWNLSGAADRLSLLYYEHTLIPVACESHLFCAYQHLTLNGRLKSTRLIHPVALCIETAPSMTRGIIFIF